MSASVPTIFILKIFIQDILSPLTHSVTFCHITLPVQNFQDTSKFLKNKGITLLSLCLFYNHHLLPTNLTGCSKY